MIFAGCHLSSSGGYAAMVRHAVSLDANTFAYFTRNPRGSKAKTLDPADIAQGRLLLEEHKFGTIVAHGAYTMNLCTREPEAREFACSVLSEDLERMSHIPGQYYNFHPGSHVGQGTDIGISQICDSLKKAMAPSYPVTVLLETMAGKGSEVGRSFEELKAIIDGVGRADLGVCLDTCHVSDGGYDISGDLSGVLNEFDRIIGLDRLKALHINDSKNPVGSHKDRHACLGEGYLGLSCFHQIVTHPYLKTLPMILETPNEDPGYKMEISMLRQMENGDFEENDL